MEGLFFEAILIALLILLNGYLAGTEIAVVTARKSTIQHLAENGRRNAKIFLKAERGTGPIPGHRSNRRYSDQCPCIGRGRSRRHQGDQTVP